MFNGPVFNNETIQSNSRAVNGGGISESLDEANALYSRLSGASFELVPSSYKGGTLYSGAPGANGDLSWTRGSDAFRTNASGVLQRTPWNLLQYSEQFSNAYWTKVAVTISADSTNAPNGTTTADTSIPTTANAIHRFLFLGDRTSGVSYTLSIYAKASGYNFLYINAGTMFNAQSTFNLSNGTVSTALGTATITNVGDGWYRCSVTGTATITGNTSAFFQINSTNIVTDDTFSGNGTSGIFFWGAQLVEGTTAQTYLPTTDRLNFPRLSYMYGSCPSVLLEPQRTNVLTYSNDFTSAIWQKDNTSIVANSTTSPDGNANASTLVENNTNSEHRLAYGSPVSASTTYSATCYVKRASGTRNFFIQINSAGGTTGAGFAWFDLGTATASSITTLVGTFVGVSATISSVGSDWYRCCLVFTTNVGNTAVSVAYAIYDGGRQYLGNGTNGLYVYGAQLEAGAYPTTYIPTTSATATRIADSFSRSNIYTNGLISASGGTLFFEFRGSTVRTRDNFSLIGIGDSASIDGNSLVLFPSSRFSIAKYVGGSATPLASTSTDTSKVLFKWNGSTADIFINGVKVISATSFPVTNMQFLTNTGTGIPMFIQQMALFPTPLSDADCISLTADYTDGTSIVGDYERYVSQRSGAVENLSGVTNLIQNLK